MPIGIELAQAVLSNVLYNPKKRQVDAGAHRRACPEYYSVPMDVLAGPEARQGDRRARARSRCS